MLKSYLTIAVRNLRRHASYSILNILGLTLGILVTLFIMLFIIRESSYDVQHKKGDRIYRVSTDITEPDDAFRWASTQLPLARQLRDDYPEVEDYVRFIPNGDAELQYEDRIFLVEKTFIVDSTVNNVFTFEYLSGDPQTVLRDPGSVVLDETTAKRIFGQSDPIGKMLKSEGGRDFKVTGVYRDMPSRSHLIANAMLSANTIPGLMQSSPGQWGGFNLYSYVLLKEGADPTAFAAKLPEVVEKYVATIFDQFDIRIRYELLPLRSIHLNSSFQGEPEPSGERSFLFIFGAIAFFVLIIACINYMNLATARATMRATEVGVKKVLGSGRGALIRQFLSESMVFTAIALVLSFALAHLFLNLFNQTFNVELERALLWSPQILFGALVIVLITGFLGGSYPAFYLSAFNPIDVLKGTLSSDSGNPVLRKGLVGLQFVITIFTIISMGVIHSQMNYLQNKQLGFDKDHLLTFSFQNPESSAKYAVLRDKLLSNPKIDGVGTASSSPGYGFGKLLMNVENRSGGMEQYGVDNYSVDYDFFPTIQAEIVVGRNFSREFGTDTAEAVLVNESMVRRFGWTDAIGKKFQFGTEDTLPVRRVIGVVKDFHQQSLYEPIAPLLFVFSRQNQNVHVRLTPGDSEDLQNLISFVERQWQEVLPDIPFEYEFVDQAFYDLYEADRVRARIFTLFSILMLVIACLGLLGLASYTIEQRGKEISIRRILGANPRDILVLLTRNYLLLVSLATVPACIAAYFFMRKWLESFAYHDRLHYSIFVMAFISVVLAALLTTSYHAMRAVRANPVDKLRNE